ncbi:MAG: hypoxanthine phosphoribosyltransferase, partial [Holosporaceae bacterium]|nr:hypoxanthine phosphoribosyltransferase [Holosporaceae bacterium]
TGKHVLLVEDIIDSGRTLAHLHRHLSAQGPAELKICTLLDKPARRVDNTITPDYVGFVIPDEFVIGYGLDYAQRYRNLSYIGILRFSE